MASAEAVRIHRIYVTVSKSAERLGPASRWRKRVRFRKMPLPPRSVLFDLNQWCRQYCSQNFLGFGAD
jgi:hypothetical protein